MTAVCDAIYRGGRTSSGCCRRTSGRCSPPSGSSGSRAPCRASASTSADRGTRASSASSRTCGFDGIQPDDVLVSVNGDSPVGHFGELTGNAAQVHGCVGVILDGNLRDTDGLRDIGLQVFYRELSPLNAIGRWEMAATQVPVTIGEVEIQPGDVIAPTSTGSGHPGRRGRASAAGLRDGDGRRGSRPGRHARGALPSRRAREARLHLMPTEATDVLPATCPGIPAEAGIHRREAQLHLMPA